MAAGPERSRDAYDDPPRSIFSTLWFRALVVILVLGIVAVIAVPYVLDMVNPSLSKPTASKPPAPGATGMPVAPAPPAPAPSATEPPAPAASTTEPAPRGSGTTSGMAVTPAPTAPTPDKPAEATTPAQPEAGRVAVGKPAVTPPATSRRPPASGTYWVQVGAFKDQATAKRLAERLRAENFNVVDPVKSSTRGAAAPAGDQPTDRYNVFVSGMAADELTAKLTAKGLAADTVAGGVVVKPSLPLREAVTLSRELAGEGLRVQVRRAAAPAASAGSGSTVYRVRVGSFPDRDAAQAALKELEAKGYKAFIARGGE